MMKSKELSLDLINELVSYNKETGEFIWKKQRGCGVKAGDVAGFNQHGYVKLSFQGLQIFAHRLAWLLEYGSLPSDGTRIDHKNRNKKDNKISNLRLVTHSGNMLNIVKPRVDSKYSYRGVTYRHGKYQAKISMPNGKRVRIGKFDTELEASNAYKAIKDAISHGIAPEVELRRAA